MKKIIYSFSIVFTALFLASCEGDLDLTNPAELGVDNFIIDEATSTQALFRVYDVLQNRYFSGSEAKMFQGLYSDELKHTGSFPHLNEALVNSLLANNAGIRDMFSLHYRAINAATEVIRLTSELDELSIEPVAQERIIAEARALRAYTYFQLVKVYGGLPISERTIPLDGLDASNTPRSSREEVYSYILNEVSLAEGKIAPNNPYTRFTNNALQVLKAQVHLFLENYSEAESALQPLIGQYSLTDTYDELFVNGDNSSAIFRVDYNSSDSNELSAFFTPTGRREVAPSDALINAFEAGDLRLNKISNPNNPNTVFVNKYANPTAQPYVFRYADVLLMYAETLARRNDPSAVTYLNDVRNRAGLGPIPTLNSSNFRDVIAQERRVEFFAEGKRWDDVVRLGLAEQVINSKQGISFSTRMLLWPIPQNEIDRNSLINQSDQNPGY